MFSSFPARQGRRRLFVTVPDREVSGHLPQFFGILPAVFSRGFIRLPAVFQRLPQMKPTGKQAYINSHIGSRGADAKGEMARLHFTSERFLLGEDSRTIQLFERIKGVARIGDNPVLVHGDTGVGKEGIARAIHHNGPRAKAVLVIVNCASVTDSLADSEWFGHIKGSFTGADKDKTGVFEEADKGTIFLDEVADLTPMSQSKLLRVLQEMEIRKVGSSRTKHIDVRVVAATNKDLDALSRNGGFRRDLLYRLAGERIVVPALRERQNDIKPLAQLFAREIAEKYGHTSLKISPTVLDLLHAHEWPGNVRELKHIVEAAALQCLRENQKQIGVNHLPETLPGRHETLRPYEVEKLLDLILRLLRERSPRSMSELARETGRNDDAVRRHVEKLEAEGLARLERRRGPGGTRIHLEKSDGTVVA
jgi:transcriptional regulator with GAF, ATPase, and Fis domain